MNILIFLLFVKTIYCCNPLIRQTHYGLIRGTEENSMADPKVSYYSFMGIPYAQPPIGKLRFQDPLPPKKWTGIKDTITHSQRCVQFSENFNGPDVIGIEDCLYLNVFIPKTAEQKLMPVLFWIHGGTFIFGSSAPSGPDYLMEKQVVVVTIQYRLNVFGFLSTGDKYALGNWGLKDQVMALKWVQQNIINFGGNPQQVTIVGESAGGSSVQYHILSQKSTGLFQNAISHSGSTLNRWALQLNPHDMALKLAKGLGIPNSESQILVEKLQNVDYRTLITAAFNSSIVGNYTPYYAQPFCPIIEIESNDSFISHSTFALLTLGRFNKVPYILGYNTEEGSFAYFYIENGRADINVYASNKELLIPLSLNIDNNLCSKIVLSEIEKFYFENGPTTDRGNWINYMSQELFVRGIRKSVELMYNYMPIYYYKFSYRGSRNESYIDGVGHHEELLYLWYSRNPGANTRESKSDMLTRKRLVTLWTNFATTGNATFENDKFLQNVTWSSVSQKEYVPFLNIDKDLTTGWNPNQKEYEFWENIFNRCGNPPYMIY